MSRTALQGIEIVHWNPRRNHLPVLRRWPVGPRVGNFGDLLGPLVARHVLETRLPAGARAPHPGRLLTVGSILHFAHDGDVVWGTGVNGKVPDDAFRATGVDVRAVRGPLTARWLEQRLGVDVPAVYGDPGLLVRELAPHLVGVEPRHARAVVPNLHDSPRYRAHPEYVDPRATPLAVVERIARSEVVLTSSLHGLVVAEAMGVPAALLRAGAEPPFKYDDYVRGTGREPLPVFDDLDAAEAHARTLDGSTALDAWDQEALVAAFPVDLWGAPR